ncbi:hypothetical protein GCM10022393_06200 [Aquimarina addita]|uniref:DUF5673 domain-containing protein n=1 Tax=Aquimarina addita TaxID=870485 RepID=A0ABP7XAX4_9FLAO
MEKVLIKERLTIRLKIMAVLVIAFYLVISYLMIDFSMVLAVISLLIGVFFTSFSKDHLITKKFENETLFSCFGLVLWRKPLVLEFPDYISVFHASFVSVDEIEGTEDKYKKWVLRFFKENRHVTMLEDYQYDYIVSKANELSLLLDIPVHDTSKI